jgi:isopenicillin N synthase-like dioxygenase
MSTPQGIPSVDLSDFLSGNENRINKFVNDLGQAYEEIGFVALRNHQVSDELIQDIYKKNEAFFSLPEDLKKAYEIQELAGQRGYTSFGKEHAKGMTEGDLKEFWHFGQFVDDDEKRKAEYPDNIDVKEVDGYLKTGKETYQALENTGMYMLRAIALYLDLDKNYFDAFVHNGNSILRPIHYPPVKTLETKAVRAGEHEDINLITLLVGASADGLQVLNKQGEWKSVTAIEDHIVVNVGDMLQRLTNNKLRSTTHRVINPPEAKMGTSRYSVPFFLHPVSEMPLNCLPETIDASHPKKYNDITAGEYLTERLIEIGLK